MGLGRPRVTVPSRARRPTLEARLTDLITRRILDEQVRPRFRQNDFDGGIEAGVGAIAAVIAGQPLPASRPSSSFRHVGSIGGLLFGIAIFTVVIGAFSLLALFMPGFFGWFLYVFLMFFYAAFPTQFFPPYGGVVACGAWIIAFPILRSWLRPWSKDFDKRHPTLAGVAASGGHGSGGRWSGGGGGGGGFSGGGGSFGGGGSSSSW